MINFNYYFLKARYGRIENPCFNDIPLDINDYKTIYCKKMKYFDEGDVQHPNELNVKEACNIAVGYPTSEIHLGRKSMYHNIVYCRKLLIASICII